MNTLSQPENIVDTLIIGAGISGLSLAHTLQKLKVRKNTEQSSWKFLITESQERVGGNITTAQAEDFLWEEGPNGFSLTSAMLKLIVEVGLQSELVLADRRLPQYIYSEGKLQSVPMDLPGLINSQLVSRWGKLRAFIGALGFVRPAIGIGSGNEETVAQFFSRHLGSEVTERLIAPFVCSAHAGDIEQISVSAAFGRITQLEKIGGGLLAGALLSLMANLKSARKPRVSPARLGDLGSFTKGLQILPQAIADQLKNHLRLNWQVKSLYRTERQTYMAEISTPEGFQQVETRSVVLTSPAYVTANFLKPLQPQVSQALEEFIYPPIACVVLAYPNSAFRETLRGSGILIPRNQGIRTLYTIWSSNMFPGRTSSGWQVLTSFIGGATDYEIINLTSEKIVQAVHQDLQQVLLSQEEEVQPRVLAVRLWRRAVPQYSLGHQRRLNQINQGLQQLPGLFLCGNYMGGVALSERVQCGLEKAIEVHQYLQRI